MNTSVLKKMCGVMLGIACLALPALPALADDSDIVGMEQAVLTQAPNVPPPITRKHATKVVINLEVREVTKTLADGVQYVFWTFGGDVPGSFIRIREGDEVEFHLNNHQDSKMPHNIDLHAVTGPGGGAVSSFTAPGHSSQFSFRASKAGLYVYHCATAPVGMHVGNGMYGLILVEPKEGFPPVDHEYYLMQGEFYTTGKFGEPGLQAFDMEKAEDERPSYVVFNGAVGSMTGDKALTAKVGDKIRLFVGNGGPNLTSSFHVIGTIFDTVYQEGGIPASHNVQTTSIPPGGAAIVEFQAKVPGTYTFVDHALFRAFNKGAVGMIRVDGPQDLAVYSGKQADTIYVGKEIPVTAVATVQPQPAAQTPASAHATGGIADAQLERGRAVYMQSCFVCHQPNGAGLANTIPPLAKSDFLARLSTEDYVRGAVNGRTGAITVNGKNYNGTMTPMNYLTDSQLADVLTYVRKSFGNSGEAVTLNDVSKVRHEGTPNLAQSSFE